MATSLSKAPGLFAKDLRGGALPAMLDKIAMGYVKSPLNSEPILRLHSADHASNNSDFRQFQQLSLYCRCKIKSFLQSEPGLLDAN